MATLIANTPLIEPREFKRVEKDGKFEVMESELESFVGTGLARLTSEAGEADSEEEKSSEADQAPEWTKKISPEEYLEKYPNGPAAELARKVLEAAKGAETSEES